MTDTQKRLFDEYKEFIFTHTIPDGMITAKDDFHLRLDSPYAEGQVNFYDLEDANAFVVELCVMQTKDDKACFYLHFELKELGYAKELFAEMLGSYIALKDMGKTRILLCCTSAFTTTYFANKLNETAQFLALPLEFSAVSYDRVMRAAFDYDMVLLAPQVAFQEESIKRIFDDIPVIPVPPSVFASYDAAGLIETVRRELEAFKSQSKEVISPIAKESTPSDKTILAIAVIRNWGHAQIAYRLYEKGTPGEERTVLKGRLDLVKDLCDIMDTVTYLESKYDVVSISLPGIITDGKVMLETYISPDVDLVKLLEEKYRIPVVLVNDTDAAAVGLTLTKGDKGTAAFYFLPDDSICGGVGFSMGGKIYTGRHGIAGEMRFVTNALYPQTGMLMPNADIRSMTMSVASLCTKVIAATVDPDLICVCSRVISDIDELQEEVKKDIPEQLLPDMISCNEKEMKEYMLLGAMTCALNG